MRNGYWYITLLAILGLGEETQAQQAPQAPRLVVTVCVNQLNTNELENYTPILSPGGLRLLMQEGMLFSRASFPFSPVDASSAAAAVSTGSVPYYNGITGGTWLGRETLRPQSILVDPNYTYSPRQLTTSTLGDELKMSTDGRAKVYALAPAAECAILSAGHAANGVGWIEKGAWRTTDYYTPKDAWLQHFIRYYAPGADDNMSVVQAAVSCMEQTGLGGDDDADLLCLTMNTANQADDYLSLDYALSTLISSIKAKIPLERVLFVVVGNSRSEEDERRAVQQERFRVPTGKFYINRSVNLLNMFLGAVYGNGQYVEACYQNQLFVNQKLLDKKSISLADVLARSKEFLLQLDGVKNVYTASQLIGSDSELLNRVRNGFHSERSGDLLIEIAPGWELVNEDMHTAEVHQLADSAVPVIFYGADISSKRITTPITIDRIAPTIARCIRIRAPNACTAEPLF